MHIGIGVTTYKRPAVCNALWNSIMSTISSEHSYSFICAIDGEGTIGLQLPPEVTQITGPRLGIAGNKNRALSNLQDCDYVFIFDDDMLCIKPGWINLYIEAMQLLHVEHLCHFCEAYDPNLGRSPNTAVYKTEKIGGYTILHTNGIVPGVLLVSTKKTVNTVGAYDPRYRLYGYEHADWTRRAAQAGLYIPHPEHIFVKEALDYIKSFLDVPSSVVNDNVKEEIEYNSKIWTSPSKTIYIPFKD